MKKKYLHTSWLHIGLTFLLALTIGLVMKCCSEEREPLYGSADKAQTVEMIHYQQSEGRFAVEENGYINIRQ